MPREERLTVQRRFPQGTQKGSAISGFFQLETGDYLLLEDGSSKVVLDLEAQPYALSSESRTTRLTAGQRLERGSEVAIGSGFLQLETGDYLLLEDGVSRLYQLDTRIPYKIVV